MSSIEELKKDISLLQERNKRVEANKAWETSLTRKFILTLLTYVIAGYTLLVIKNPNPWQNALIPAIGFFLSTLTLPFARKIWEKYIFRNEK